METIIKGAFASVSLAAAIFFDASASQAQTYGDAPWCAVTSGGANITRDCRFKSVEECRANVLAGNRGGCSANEWLVPSTPTTVAHHPKHQHVSH
jgi:hypothetical protein